MLLIQIVMITVMHPTALFHFQLVPPGLIRFVIAGRPGRTVALAAMLRVVRTTILLIVLFAYAYTSGGIKL